ncbi:ribose 5-phosphate isomerase A [Labedaea rhizosphaerae]|uniref:Ribose 5-phosphate isomerase A n=1 Tax=Labedaea rhizosphaerae TaxID=598644 RepID=A0A4R6SN65_LABRH|nr:ribose 5-phosphate isomerase A [Labedaea rhizosphaerae]TDQ04822.1 ribose-5-phosphate isomerase [Labedaea rhizosphaerae]
MEWSDVPGHLDWSGEITNLEPKLKVAELVAERVRDGDTIGVGSGSTAFLAIQAIAKRAKEKRLEVVAIPTSVEVGLACAALGVPTTSLVHARPDWCFDGADEVDPDRNLIKGRGGALFQEKLVMAAAPETFICVDDSKMVTSLGQKHAIPLEVDVQALRLVESTVEREFPVKEMALRLAKGKDGPVLTERGNLLIDIRLESVESDTQARLIAIPGIVETGLFMGFDVTILKA